jgi:hypothetical protein
MKTKFNISLAVKSNLHPKIAEACITTAMYHCGLTVRLRDIVLVIARVFSCRERTIGHFEQTKKLLILQAEYGKIPGRSQRIG